jgi:hypothetical protein
LPTPTGYATIEQARAAIATNRLERMVPGDDQAAVDAQISFQILAASGRMDMSLGGTYALPIDTTTITDANTKARTDAFLASVCIALLCDTLAPGNDEQPGTFTAAAKAANAWLNNVAARKAGIPGMSAPIVPTFVFVEGPSLSFQTPAPFSPELFEIARNIGCFNVW